MEHCKKNSDKVNFLLVQQSNLIFCIKLFHSCYPYCWALNYNATVWFKTCYTYKFRFFSKFFSKSGLPYCGPPKVSGHLFVSKTGHLVTCEWASDSGRLGTHSAPTLCSEKLPQEDNYTFPTEQHAGWLSTATCGRLSKLPALIQKGGVGGEINVFSTMQPLIYRG